MTASYPSQNDTVSDLWKRISWNFYEIAVQQGISGLNPPSWNDSEVDSQKKIVYFTASL